MSPLNLALTMFSGEAEMQLGGAGAEPDSFVPASEGGEGAPPECASRGRKEAGEGRAIEDTEKCVRQG